MTTSFALELLDAEAGHRLQAWELCGDDKYTLGRSKDSDVVISNPYVSRTHACLHLSEAGWELLAVSRNGVFVEGRRVEQILLSDGTVFRLADRGPWIRFRTDALRASHSGGETISFDASTTPVFTLDGAQLEREVKQIADGDYFKSLQQQMAELRSRPRTGTEDQVVTLP